MVSGLGITFLIYFIIFNNSKSSYQNTERDLNVFSSAKSAKWYMSNYYKLINYVR